MIPYIGVLTHDEKLIKVCEIIFHVEIRKIKNLEKEFNNSNCIAIITESNLYHINLLDNFNKPILILPKLNNAFDILKSIINFSDYFSSNNLQELQDNYLISHDIIFSISRHSLIISGESFLLTNLEFRLLFQLLKNPGKSIPVDMLVENLNLISPSSLYVCVKKLREKIGTHSHLLVYHNKKGYSLNLE